jgi:hypothetical protein
MVVSGPIPVALAVTNTHTQPNLDRHGLSLHLQPGQQRDDLAATRFQQLSHFYSNIKNHICDIKHDAAHVGD